MLLAGSSCATVTLETPEGTVKGRDAELVRKVADRLRAHGDEVKETFRSTREPPTVLVGLKSTPGAYGRTTDKLILLQPEAAESCVLHEAGHWYLEGGPLRVLPHCFKEALVTLVDEDFKGLTPLLSLRSPSRGFLELALTRTPKEHLRRDEDTRVVNTFANAAAAWACATLGFSRLYAICESAPDDPERVIQEIRKLLPEDREDVPRTRLWDQRERHVSRGRVGESTEDLIQRIRPRW